jgi:hypothetical protein
MNNWFLVATVTSGIAFLTHTFVGGKFVAAPLLAVENMGKVSKYTNYYCWHIVTIVLAAQTLAFWLVAQSPNENLLAMFATGGAIAFLVWNLVMIFQFKLRLMKFPQWFLFLPTSLLGLAGLYL